MSEATMPVTVKLHVAYRFPKVIQKRVFEWQTYDCYWEDGALPVVMEVEQLTVDNIIEAMQRVNKHDNGCDSMRLTCHVTVGDVQVKLQRDIDIDFHTAMFPDGRKVTYSTSKDDWANHSVSALFNEELRKAGYTDLIR